MHRFRKKYGLSAEAAGEILALSVYSVRAIQCGRLPVSPRVRQLMKEYRAAQLFALPR
jgi:hypothetical protein